jgi:aldose 1-epimerase
VYLSEVFTIAGGGYRCALAPGYGGVVLSLDDSAGAILRAGALDEAASDPRTAACFACVPWFGRLYEPLDLEGGRGPLRPSLPDAADQPLHGDGWVGAWAVEAHTEDRLICRFSARGDGATGFPPPYDAVQAFYLDAAGLHATLTVQNTGATAMPAGLGLHPYFARAAGTRLAFRAASLFTPPAPTGASQGRLGPLPGALGSGALAPLPDETLDHSFTGFAGEVLIEGGGAPIRLSSPADILHLFAPAGERYFCLEPVTHLPGAFERVQQLAPGESLSLSMSIGRG